MIKLFTPKDEGPTDRQRAIIEATLRLLGRVPLDALTTRELAAELGLSQPALFRHFTSREALLLAVVDHARADLERQAARIVEGGGPAAAQLRALGTALLDQVERTPGLPRLLFASAPPGHAPSPLREALRHMVGMQASLVAELVRQGQREGALSAACDADQAATVFVGMVQGLVLRWEIAGRPASLAAQFPPLFELWMHGVAAERAAHAETRTAHAKKAAATEPTARIDVRPLIARGVDPLAAILEAVAGLPRAGVLLLEAPFRPAPLLALLARRGHSAAAEPLAPDHWLVEVIAGGAPAVEDLRDLEPPEPMERVLAAAAALAPGEVYLARLPRFPRMLVPHLEERGLAFAILERPDGAALLRLEKPT
jgi:AcrR family transcriptional regulator